MSSETIRAASWENRAAVPPATLWTATVRTPLLLLNALLVSCAGTSPLPEAPETPEIFAPGVVSTRGGEFATTFDPDGRTVYFNRVDDGGRIPILRSCWRDGA